MDSRTSTKRTTAPLPIDELSTSPKKFSTEKIKADETTEPGIERGLQNLKQIDWLHCIFEYNV